MSSDRGALAPAIGVGQDLCVPRLATQLLFRGPAVSISDTRCRSLAANAPEVQASADVHQLLLTRSGMFVQHLGASPRRQVVVDPGTVLFFNAGDVYRTTHPRGGNHECTILRFAPAEARAAVASLDPGAHDRAGPFPAPLGPAPAHVRLAQQALRVALRAAPGPRDPNAIEEAAFGLLAAALGAVSGGDPRIDSRTRRQHRALAGDVRALLAEDPTRAHTLADLARAAGCSAFHLARVFRREHGVPIHRYLLDLRLALALERIADGADDLARLALELGFASHSHFTAAFRRGYGLPPSAVRTGLVGGQRAQIAPRRLSPSTWPNAIGSSIET